MKIYFARHAESQANVLHIISNRESPHGLTETGREQARQLAEKLKSHPLERIYTSPIQRALETSAIIAESLRLEYERADGLSEYDCGIAEGRSDEAAWHLWQAEYEAWTFYHDYEHKIKNGESFWNLRQRFGSFLEGLITTYAATSAEILCISHGGIYSVMLPLVLKNVDLALMMKYGFYYTSCIVAEHRSEGLVCVEWNGIPIQPRNTFHDPGAHGR
jgi:broad specificity phosphatase PhoE